MSRRLAACVLLTAYLLTTAGCSYEVFNRKFVRKKKKPEGPPSVYHIEPFVKPSNSDIYSRAYLFWKTWESELLIALSPAGFPRTVNNLRVRECLRESISNMGQMRNCLNEEKSREFAEYIKQLELSDIFLRRQDLSDMTLARMRQDIEAHKRNVEIRFSPSMVKNYMAPEPASPGAADSARR